MSNPNVNFNNLWPTAFPTPQVTLEPEAGAAPRGTEDAVLQSKTCNHWDQGCRHIGCF